MYVIIIIIIICVGFFSDFIPEDYTETYYTDDGTPVITKPRELVGELQHYIYLSLLSPWL